MSSDHANGTSAMPHDQPTLTSVNALIRSANRLLDKLATNLQVESPVVTSQWARRVESAKRKDIEPSTTISALGVTGCGKSSLINAILDEERVVPTSCMQACTAAIIEIAWNDSNNCPFRAEIDFISSADWKKELEILMKDTLDATGKLSKSCKDDASEAGVAYAKIIAVYPFLTKTSLPSANVQELLNLEYLQPLLDNKIRIEGATARGFHEKLSKYVEGKERSRDDWEQNGLAASDTLDQLEYWPLIRKVRIFLKKYALETGSVIVDLPGVADANAARGSIAQKYLSNCAAIWIVAPIVRAVDDKMARRLLGEGFKRQLRRDGVLSRISFICSKADEIVVQELRNKLRHNYEFTQTIMDIEQASDRAVALRSSLEDGVKQAWQKYLDYGRSMHKVKDEYSIYRKLGQMVKSGQTVHPPLPQRQKRKDQSEFTQRSKQSRIEEHFEVKSTKQCDQDPGISEHGPLENIETLFSSNVTPNVPSQSTRWVEQDLTQPALSTESVDAKLEDLKAQVENLRAKRDEAKQEHLRLTSDSAAAKIRLKELSDRAFDAYLQARNSYCADSISRDFVEGIADMNIADAQESVDFDPDEGVDTDENIQQTLPVFCTSSQGFQKLRNRLEGEKISSKFRHVDQTGIPSVIEHCRQLGLADLVRKQGIYVDDIKQLLNSVRLWLSNPAALPMENELSVSIEDSTISLMRDLENSIDSTLMEVTSIISTQIYNRIPSAITAAENAALEIVAKWGAPPNADEPGLYYATYHAVVRRSGIFQKCDRTIDFGEDLLAPFMQRIDGIWTQIFNTRIPAKLQSLGRDWRRRIDEYSATLEVAPDFLAASSTNAAMYRGQIRGLRKFLSALILATIEKIKKAQQEANRMFNAVVAGTMAAIYGKLESDRGPGVFARMKAGMESYVLSMKEVMYNHAASSVQKSLDDALIEVKEFVLGEFNKISEPLKRDCDMLFKQGTMGEAYVSDEKAAAIHAVIQEIDDLLAGKSTTNTQVVVEAPANSLMSEVRMEGVVEPAQEQQTQVRSTALLELPPDLSESDDSDFEGNMDDVEARKAEADSDERNSDGEELSDIMP